jgi:hypothetical protein
MLPCIDERITMNSLQRHHALDALEAHFVVDVAARFHPLGGVHGLAASGALLGLRWLREKKRDKIEVKLIVQFVL